MWKVLLCFVGHRALLLATALMTLSFGGGHSGTAGPFFARVAELPESREVMRLAPLAPGVALRETKDPFHWLAYFLTHYLGISPLVALLLLANVVVLLFLWELHELMTRMVMPEVASAAAVLAVLWPAGYELSLGSTFALPCFLALATMRHATDNRWGLAGPALALLALTEPLAFGLIPLLVVIYWYFMRHFEWPPRIKKGLCFVVPIALVVLWRYPSFESVHRALQTSALANLFAVAGGASGAWTFSHSYAGQTISIVFFLGGALLSLGGHTTLLQRVVPLYLVVVVLAFTPYGSIASRILLAAPALLGIASHSAPSVIGVLQVVMLLLGLHEAYAVFR